jgi:hypothetical protein
MPKLKFVTNSLTPHKLPNGETELRQSIAVLGGFSPLKAEDLRRYVLMFPLTWVEA